MTKWICIFFTVVILCLSSLGDDYDQEYSVGIPFYKWGSDGRLISPKFRHFHPRLPNNDEEVDQHYMKHKTHNRRSHGGSKLTPKSKIPKSPTNSSKMTCRDKASKYNDTEEEICPEFAKEIGNITQAVGRDAKLECVVENLGKFRVAWMRIETKTILTLHRHVISRNYRISLSHSEHRIYVLHINSVQESDRGSYMCQVNTVPMLYQVGFLEVVVPPDIIEEQSSSDMFAREGTDVTLKCAAKGRPEPKLSWRREDYKPVGAGNWQKNNLAQIIHMADERPPIKNVSLHEGAELTIRKVSRLHMGAYLCIASNGVPPAVSRRITLQVNFPPMIWIPNQLVGAPLGGNVTVECNTEAYPESMNYWSRHESEMIAHGPKFSVIFKVSTYRVNMMLTVHRLEHSDFGTYRCFARNSLGSTEGTMRIYEIHAPHPIKEPSTAKIHSLDGTSINRDGDLDYEAEMLAKDLEKGSSRYPNSSIEMYDDMVPSAGHFSKLSVMVNLLVSISISLVNFWILHSGT